MLKVAIKYKGWKVKGFSGCTMHIDFFHNVPFAMYTLKTVDMYG